MPSIPFFPTEQQTAQAFTTSVSQRRRPRILGLLWVLWFQVHTSPPLPVPRLFPTYETCIAYTQTMEHRAVVGPVRYWCADKEDAA